MDGSGWIPFLVQIGPWLWADEQIHFYSYLVLLLQQQVEWEAVAKAEAVRQV